jgi:hypothetical protein
MILSAYETIDVNPASDLRIDLMYIRGSPTHLPIGSAGYTGESGQSISLAGATILSEVVELCRAPFWPGGVIGQGLPPANKSDDIACLSSTVTIQLNESQRAAAIRLSAPKTTNVFALPKCVGGSQEANPYTADADGALCTDNSGTYTSQTCKDVNGVIIHSAGVGTSASLVACEGSTGGYGPRISVDMDAGALFDFMGNPSPTQTSHMLYPEYTYTAAKCEGGFQDSAYADPYTTDFNGAACLGAFPIAGTFTPATCKDSSGVDSTGNNFASLPTMTQCEGADHLFVLSQVDDTVKPTVSSAIMNYGTGLLILTADETLDGTSGTDLDCINGTAMVIKSLPTGDTYIPSDCDIDTSGTLDDDQAGCEGGSNIFAQPKCARCLNANGDIAGDSSSQSNCENDPDGGTYLENGGDASSEVKCRGAAHVFAPVSLTGLRIAAGHRKDGVALTLKLPEVTRLLIQEQESVT